MATEAPSWADQWGEGGIGAMEEVNPKKEEAVSNKKKTTVFAGIGKAAMVGAQKVKNGTTMGIKWVKNQCLKKDPPK